MADYDNPQDPPPSSPTAQYPTGGEHVMDPVFATKTSVSSAGRMDICSFEAKRSELVTGLRTCAGNAVATTTGVFMGLYRQTTRNVYELIGTTGDRGTVLNVATEVIDMDLVTPVRKGRGERYAVALLPVGAGCTHYGFDRPFTDTPSSGKIFTDSWVHWGRSTATGLTDLPATIDMATLLLTVDMHYMATLGPEGP